MANKQSAIKGKSCDAPDNITVQRVMETFLSLPSENRYVTGEAKAGELQPGVPGTGSPASQSTWIVHLTRLFFVARGDGTPAGLSSTCWWEGCWVTHCTKQQAVHLKQEEQQMHDSRTSGTWLCAAAAATGPPSHCWATVPAAHLKTYKYEIS